MREAEEVERDAVRIRVAYAPRPMKAKVDEVRLVRVEREPVPSKPLSQHVHDPLGVVETLERHYAVIGVPHEDAVPFEAHSYVPLEPFIQHMVQVDVCEQRRDDATLRGALGRALKESVFEHACLQPFVDHPANNAVRDSPVEKRTEVMMLDRVVVFGDVDIQHPAQPLSTHEGQTQRTQGLMRRPPWSE